MKVPWGEGQGRSGRVAGGVLGLGAAIAASLVLLPAGGDARVAAAASTQPAYFTLTGGGRSVPKSFFGISMEDNQLPTYEQEGPVFDRVLSLLRPQDGSLLLLRIGGRSADHTYWNTPLPKAPKHLIEIKPGWVKQLGELARSQRLRVMLDLNLAVHSPTLEANFARSVMDAIPRGRLAGLEIGNEPDLYWRQPWLSQGRVTTTIASTPRHWADNYGAPDYRRDYSDYARTLISRVGRIPLGGPETISNKPEWMSAIEGLGPLNPGFITIHRYASSNCWPRTSPWWPTIPLMLNESSSAGLAHSVLSAVAFAHSRHQALRLTEMNSISCGGNRNVANTFTTALWAPDALFEMVRAGVDSVSWHIRPAQLNAPFLPGKHSIQVLPELYGLAIFEQMLQPGAELLNSSVSSPLHVKGWAVRTGRGTRVLLINKGALTADATLRLGTGSRRAFVRRLSAPGIGADHGVTFGGQTIGSDARWHGRLSAATVRGNGGTYQLALPGYSAALVSVWR